MNALVGYGVSSDSDSEAEAVNNETSRFAEDLQQNIEGATAKKTRNFLLESGSASSDSEEEDTLASSSSPPHPLAAASFSQPTPPLNSNKLPSPPLNASADSSVFSNPFRAQIERKLSALQKHVPLTMQAKPSHIGGKRMCVSYRKDGRCRFGIKCKFAHDSDLQTTATPSDCQPYVNEESSTQAEEESQSQEKERESEGQQGKKRRVGLSNTLIPPKRAMKQYTMQREREQINMSR